MSRRGHALVIGGTGMLRGVVLGLADEHRVVSVVARSHARLSALTHEAAHQGGTVNPVAADWHDVQQLALGLRAAITAHGPVELAVCWVHDDAAGALASVLEFISSERHPPRCFHVLGSASNNSVNPRIAPPARVEGVRYRSVTLGFVLEGEGSRWLTHDEIADGVLDAIHHDLAESVVGVIDPWDRRP